MEDQPDDDIGRLDILYRRGDIWKIVDFKTDQIKSMQDFDPTCQQRYHLQLQRYARAVQDQLGVTPHPFICYLDVNNRIEVVAVLRNV